MPTYEYECDNCSYMFEKLQSMLDKKLKKCPKCKKLRLHRLIGSGSGIIFKGSGFYETDYKNKGSSSSDSSDSSESKTETKTKTPKKKSEKESSVST